MPRGRPRKPTHLKVVEGNPGKRPLPKNEPRPEAVSRLPMPQGLPPKARTEFKRITAELADMGVLHRADLHVIVAHCLAVDRLLTSMRRLRRADDYIATTSQGASPSPWVRIQRDATQDITRLCAELGLSPAARTRIEVLPPSEHEDDDSVEGLRREARARDTRSR